MAYGGAWSPARQWAQDWQLLRNGLHRSARRDYLPGGVDAANSGSKGPAWAFSANMVKNVTRS